MATKIKKALKAATKSKASKPVNKKVAPVKKAAPAKKAAAKKPVAKKPVAKKPAKAQPKKAAKKVAAPKKAAAKLIKTPTPVKKTAKAGLKKADPKKLTKAKKITSANAKVSAKKPEAKKEKIVAKKDVSAKKSNVAKPAIEKPVKSVTTAKESAKETFAHKAELKKAMAKQKAKQKEESKKIQKPFVIPKTHTEKARKYEPEFTKSVLDQSPAENNGPTMRYSDNELVEFRELITRKLETAKKELGYLQGLITRKDQMGGDESDNRYMTMEDGSLSMEREQLSQMASRQITFIDHLEKAMMRIENKTYGICRITGKLIDKARLRAVPHATLSIEAKMGIAK